MMRSEFLIKFLSSSDFFYSSCFLFDFLQSNKYSLSWCGSRDNFKRNFKYFIGISWIFIVDSSSVYACKNFCLHKIFDSKVFFIVILLWQLFYDALMKISIWIINSEFIALQKNIFSHFKFDKISCGLFMKSKTRKWRHFYYKCQNNHQIYSLKPRILLARNVFFWDNF